MRERRRRRRELRGKRRKEQKMSFFFLKHAGLLMVADFMDNLLLNCFLFFIFFSKMEGMQMFAGNKGSFWKRMNLLCKWITS